MVNHQRHHLQAMAVALLVALVALQEHFAGVVQRLVVAARSFVAVAQSFVADSRLVVVHTPVEHSLAVVHTLVEHTLVEHTLAVAHTLVERSLVADTRLVAVHNLVAYQHFLYAKLVYLQNISLLPPDLSIRARAS